MLRVAKYIGTGMCVLVAVIGACWLIVKGGDVSFLIAGALLGLAMAYSIGGLIYEVILPARRRNRKAAP